MASIDRWKAEFNAFFELNTRGLIEQFQTKDPSLIPLENIRDAELKSLEGKINAYNTNHKNQAFVHVMEHITDVMTKLDKIDVEFSQNRKTLRRQIMQLLADARNKLESKLHSPDPNCMDCQKVVYRN